MRFLVINGPNINMLGIREPEIYGHETYEDLLLYIGESLISLGVEPEFFQSNHEGYIVEAIQKAYGRVDGIIINPAAYTHTSIAILDALKAVAIPAVEVHISDVDSREDFRKISYIREACIASVSGRGFRGYADAAEILIDYLNK
ncbi:MAG: type II 3-dehydroquinate dehydratase [Oscillospiraceae bacterium]|jgi:3-dehydroquinate dehydratase-2